MNISGFSKQLKMLGGGVLLVLAYSPIMFDMLESKKNSFLSDGAKLSVKDALGENFSRVQTRLTNSLKEEYLSDLVSNLNVKTDLGEPKYVASATRSSAKKVVIPRRVKEFTSGAYKGGKLIKGTIHSNFYVDAKGLSIPVNVIDKVISSLSSKIDFRRSLKRGDQFEIAFNGNNELIYSKIKTRRRSATVYKFGKEGYFFENGEKIGGRRSNGHFGSPVRGKMKVTSPFGIRIHPITRRSRKHTGVDIAARYGTPIYAIYDGVITRASRYAGYGKCVDISHKNGYASRYAHLSRFVVRHGVRVKKGQLIGFSGSSGMVTGPHLHLELARNNVHVNPLGVKMIPEKAQRVSNNRQFNAVKNYFSKVSNSIK